MADIKIDIEEFKKFYQALTKEELMEAIRHEVYREVPIDDRTVADILEAVANKLESGHIWIQGHYERFGGNCLVGAIMREGIRSNKVNEIKSFLREYMSDRGYITHPRMSVENWNDQKGREKFEVIEVLRQAAKEWRHQNVL